MTRKLAVVFTATALAACGPGTDAVGDAPATSVETRGDTTIVRTLSGSEWEADATLVPELSIGEVDGPAELLSPNVNLREEGRHR